MGEGTTVAVIGAAGYGMNLVRNLSRSKCLGLVCEADAAIREVLREKYPEIGLAEGIEAALTKDEIDAVAIAGPLEGRVARIRRALEAGKHVLAQRPLVCEDREAEDLTALAEERGLVLLVDHLLSYHPAFEALATLVASEELGEIETIRAVRTHNHHFRSGDHPSSAFAPNDIAMILALMGSRPSTLSVHASRFENGVPGVNQLNMSFAGGSSAGSFVSWCYPYRSQRLEVVGTKQTAIFDEMSPWSDKLKLYALETPSAIPSLAEAEPRSLHLEGTEPLHALCTHFLACVAGEETPRTGGRFVREVTAVLNAAMRSLERGGAVQTLSRERPVRARNSFLHPTAVIDEDVEIGAGSMIWHFTHLLAGTRLGEGANLGQNVMVGPKVTVGKDCKIQNNVSIYEGVTLEDHVFCGPSVVFTNVNVPRAEISRKSAFAQTRVRTGATIGANATVVAGVTLGRYAFVGAGSVVTNDVPDHAMVYGNPARFVDWVCICGHKLSKKLACRACGRVYVKDGANLIEGEAKSEKHG